KIGTKNDIKIISYDSIIFEHQSSKNPDKWYFVDMQLGILPIMSAKKIDQEKSSYSTVEFATLKNYNLIKRSNNKEDILPEALTLISLQSLLINEAIYHNSSSKADEDLYQLALNKLKWFYNNLKNLCEKNDPTINKNICKFIGAYKKCRLV
ncbi:1347_t:CDS:2, partial [Gigaspora margarita]